MAFSYFSVDILFRSWHNNIVKIKILKECEAPKMRTRYCCDICVIVPTRMQLTWLYEGEEFDPELWSEKIDLRGLKYRVDYDIIEYP